MDVRTRDRIPIVERTGYRYRQHLGALATASDLLSSPSIGVGALRVFDDVGVDAQAQASLQAHDGLETIVYVLEGICHLTRGADPPIEIRRAMAARLVGGRGALYEARNRTTSPLRMLVAAVVAPRARAPAPLATEAFDPDLPGMVWLATPAAEHTPGSIALGLPVRFGIATLAPGLEIRFSSAVDRGLYLKVIDGYVELNSGFLDEGSDAKLSLESSPVRIQGVRASRLAVVDVPMDFVQELWLIRLRP
jgi:hypothetical protein